MNKAEITEDDGDDVDSDPETGDDVDEDGDGDGDDDDEDEEEIPVEQTYDLALTKTLTTAGPFEQNSLVSYDIVVTNEGSLNATNVEVTDHIPTGMTYVSGGWTVNGSDATQVIPSLLQGQSVTLSITLQIDATFQGTSLVNKAEITEDDGDDVDSDPETGDDVDEDGDGDGDDDDEDEEEIPVEQTYDLALTKTLTTAGPFEQNSLVSYDIVVTNEGSLNATNVEVTDHIPTGMTYVSGGWTVNGSDATQVIPSLLQGQSVTLSITLQIDATFQGTSLVNKAEITEDDGDDVDSDPETGDDVDEDGDGDGDDDDEDEEEIPVEQTYDLALTKTLTTAGPFEQGDLVSYDIVVTNEGSLNAANIEVTDHIPTGMTYVSGGWTVNGSDATQVIPSLLQGQSVTLSITLQIDATFQGTSLVNKAEITEDDGDDVDSDPETGDDVDEDGDGDGDDDDEDEEEIPVEQVFDLALTKTLNGSTTLPIYPGGTVTFDIEVTNQGSLDASNIEITDYIPAGLILADGNWTQSGTLATRTIASLGQGASTTVSITFTVDANYQGGDIVNFAEVSDADNALNQPDVDSTPDQDNTNDAGGQPNSPADDAVNGDGTGTPGDGNAATDEDDHDPALITVDPLIDLELEKSVSDLTPSVGDVITFTLTLTNQGPSIATVVTIVDHLPNGYSNIENVSEDGHISGSAIIWDNLTVGVGETLTFTYDVTVEAEGSYLNCG